MLRRFECLSVRQRENYLTIDDVIERDERQVRREREFVRE
jgi:hypothetical protein